MTVNYHTHISQLRKVFERILYLVVSVMLILVSQFSSAAQSSDEIGNGGATGIGFGAESNSNYLIQVISALILIVVILFSKTDARNYSHLPRRDSWHNVKFLDDDS